MHPVKFTPRSHSFIKNAIAADFLWLFCHINFSLSSGVFGSLDLTLPTLQLLEAAALFSFGVLEGRIVELDLRDRGHPALAKLSLKKATRLCSD